MKKPLSEKKHTWSEPDKIYFYLEEDLRGAVEELKSEIRNIIGNGCGNPFIVDEQDFNCGDEIYFGNEKGVQTIVCEICKVKLQEIGEVIGKIFGSISNQSQVEKRNSLVAPEVLDSSPKPDTQSPQKNEASKVIIPPEERKSEGASPPNRKIKPSGSSTQEDCKNHLCRTYGGKYYCDKCKPKGGENEKFAI